MNYKYPITNIKSQNYCSTLWRTSRLRSKYISITYLIVALVIVLGVFPKKSFAEGLSLGVFPPITTIDALPPVNIHTPLKVQNTGDDEVTVQIKLKPFKASQEENGTVAYLRDETAFSSGDVFFLKKISVSYEDTPVTSITLAPKEEKELSVDIPVSKNAVAADYYFSVVFTAASNEGISPDDNTQATTANIAVASHILLSIGPKEAAKGEITEFSTSFFKTEGPVPFTIRFTNTSKHAIAPTGSIYIKNIFNQTIGKIDLLPVTVLGETTRLIPDRAQISDKGVIDEALYNAFLQQGPKAIWQEKFLLGPYHATVMLKLSDTGPILKEDLSFFAFPLQLLIALIIVILLLITIIQRVRKRMKRKE